MGLLINEVLPKGQVIKQSSGKLIFSYEDDTLLEFEGFTVSFTKPIKAEKQEIKIIEVKPNGKNQRNGKLF